MNLSHYQPMDPDVNCRKSKKRVKACGKALPTHDSAAILLLEPGKGALRLKAWDGFFDRSPPVFFRLPDPLRDWRPAPALAERLPQRLRIIACICGNDFEACARGRPLWATGDITPPAAGKQDIEQRLQDFPKRCRRHPTTALGWCRGKDIREQTPLSSTHAIKSSCHTALLHSDRTVEHKSRISGIDSYK